MFRGLKCLTFAASVSAVVAQSSWHEVTPDARAAHAMSYDSLRGRMVMFGGEDGQTWEWDGATWHLMATAGPGPRSGHAMVYDPHRAQTLLFGGFDGSWSMDTWAWDGTTWTFLTNAGPSGRDGHAMAFDAIRSRVVLFGGGATFGVSFGDTWEWDGVAWAQVATSGPPVREGHAMVYDATRSTSILFGGANNGGARRDTWEWDGASWTEIVTAAPPAARFGHAMVYDAARGTSVMFGGRNGSIVGGLGGDTWYFDGVSWTMRSTTGPVARFDMAMAYDPNRGRTVLFGGSTSTYSPGLDGSVDLWEFDGIGWAEVGVTGPTRRAGHAMVYDTLRDRTVLFGGASSLSVGPPSDDDTFVWDGVSWSVASTSGPPAREEHAMAYDAARDRVVCFGGYGGSFLGDTWVWDGAAWTEIAVSGPSARMGHAMAYDAARQRVVLFGGVDENFGYLADTWEWDGAAWTAVVTTGPVGREQHAMAYDARRERVVLFGGADTFLTRVADTWEWDGVAWTQFGGAAPPARAEHAMAFDTQRGRVLTCFGNPSPTSPYFDDTWEWDGSTWSQDPSVGPVPRSGHGLVYDRSADRLVVFGGYGGDFGYRDQSDTWTRRMPVRFFGTACTTSIGVARLVETADSIARVGMPFTIDVESVPLAAPVYLGVGFVSHDPPIDLTAVGMTGCAIGLDPVQVVTLPTGTTPHSARWSIGVPNNPNLAELSFFVQGFVLDGGANPFGVALTQAGEAVVTL